MRSLGDDEAEIMGEAVSEPLMPVRGGIGVTKRGFHPDLAIAHLDRTDWRVVRPQIEGAAAFEIEAGVMPMTGQNAVLDSASLERKPMCGQRLSSANTRPRSYTTRIGR
jgi:hypothetical protein